MSDIAGVIVGAVLGLVAALVVEPLKYSFIERPRVVRELAPALLAEAADACKRAVLISMLLRRRHGTIDRQQLEWAREQLERLNDDEARRHARTFTEELRHREGLTDAQREQLRQQFVVRGRVPMVARLEMPFFDAQVHRIGVLSLKTQVALQRVRAEVRIFNQLTEDLRTFTTLSFDNNLTRENHANVVGNVRGTEEQMIARAEELARAFERLRAHLPLE